MCIEVLFISKRAGMKYDNFIDIEIFNDVNGAPKVSILKELKFKKIEISISHESKYAVAFALLVV